MQTDEVVITILTNLATLTPVLVVYLIGFIVAVVWYRRCPKPALLVMVAVGILGLNTLVMTILQAWLPRFLFRDGRMGDLRFAYMILGAVRSLIGAVGLLVLLLAVFSDRTPRSRRPLVDPDLDSPSE